MGLPFTCIPAGIDESFDQSALPSAMQQVKPQDIVLDLAIRKVKKVVCDLACQNPAWICGADTLISYAGKLFGKPGSRDEAKSMLNALQGKTHEVITAVALYSGRSGRIDSRTVSSEVTFAQMTGAEIEWYLDTGEWEGAAGAYKIQGLASCFIKEIKGSYSSIVGLPLHEFYAMLKDNGYPYGGI